MRFSRGGLTVRIPPTDSAAGGAGAGGHDVRRDKLIDEAIEEVVVALRMLAERGRPEPVGADHRLHRRTGVERIRLDRLGA